MDKNCENFEKELPTDEKHDWDLRKLSKLKDAFKAFLKIAEPRVAQMLHRLGIGTPTSASDTILESGRQIVPDIIKANDGEVPIKQYEAAVMRSRIRGHYAKGKLQVTNKRILFRAAGTSIKGPIVQQYEFSINEIAGIEVKQKHRISIMNLLLAVYINTIGTFLGLALFADFSQKAPTFALLVALGFAAVCAIPFFTLHKKFWLKLLSLSLGVGALTAIAVSELDMFSILVGITGVKSSWVFGGAYYILWLINVLLVATVPDLVLIIKTKGSSPAFEIRRKQFQTLTKPMIEYTDFGEVLPGKDVEVMIAELGTLIDDIQTLGDMATDKWKE